MDVSQTQTASSQPSTATSTTTPLEAKVKKPKSAAQLAALAKGREVKKQKALDRASKQVVRDDESANELLERVRHSDPEAKVKTRRKRKEYDGYESYESSGNGYGSTTVKVVAAAAVVAALGGLMIKNKQFPLPLQKQALPSGGGGGAGGAGAQSNAPSVVSLSTSS